MPRWDLLARVKSAAAGVEWKTLVFGSVKSVGTSTSAIFRPEELVALADADAKLQDVARRIGVTSPRSSI